MTTEGFAVANCPECGKFSTRPLPHLMFVHKWPRKKARKWVKANAEIYKDRRDWDKRGPFSKQKPNMAIVSKSPKEVAE